MILQALENYYQVLAARGEIALAGWGTAGVSFALALAPDGALLGVQPLKITSLDGKKEVPVSYTHLASSSRPSPRRRLIRELRPTPVPMATAISRFCTGNTSDTAVSASSLTLATK